MPHKDDQIAELTNLLTGFIQEQKGFNREVTGFIQEQKAFNDRIDKKVDRIQYFLEETIAENTKMFFEEQIGLKTNIRELEEEVSELRNYVTSIASELKLLQLKHT